MFFRNRFAGVATPAVLALLLCACATTGTGHEASGTITVRSDPPGATVLADGVEIGTTPLALKPADTFRSGFTSGSDGLLVYRYQGRLMLRKAGCKDSITAVDDNVLGHDISISLECNPDYKAPAPAAGASENLPGDAAARLLRIRSLHEQGLITDEEYRTLRQRVLDGL